MISRIIKEMQLFFRKETRLKKLVAISQIFGPPDSAVRRMIDYAPYIGKEFGQASQIYNLLSFRSRNEHAKFYRAFLEKDETKKKRIITRMGKGQVFDLLDHLDIPEKEQSYYRSIEDGLRKMISTKGNVADKWVKKIFGKPLPRKVYVIPFENYSRSSTSGTLLIENPPAVGLGGNFRNSKHLFGVFLHEVLHAVVDPIIREGNSSFEEALLDYFVPHGILAEKFGLIKKFDFAAHKKKVLQNRKCSADESEKLASVMQEYRSILGKKTIWQFLQEKGFGYYLKNRPRL